MSRATLATHEAHSEDVSMSATLDRFLDGGGLWIEITTDDGELTLSEGRWTVEAPATDRHTSMVVCTHNRPVDCVTTLRTILDDDAALGALDRILVVDQGTQRVDAQPEFDEIASGLGDRLTYITQSNLGGAGGFTRGLYELVERGTDPNTDVLLMDDDVRCEPEVVVRLSAFARHTAVPTIVGAQMLNLLHPTQVIAGAECADFIDLACGRRPEGAVGESDVTGYFPDGTKNVQDRRVDADYNGWWACLIPAEVTRAIGYPLPLFFQWDDVEYGYRARAHGFPTVTLPGAGLWHADFQWKDWDDWRRYFNHRNSMITAAMHSDFPVRRLTATLADYLTRYLLSLNYATGGDPDQGGRRLPRRTVGPGRRRRQRRVRHPGGAPGLPRVDPALGACGPGALEQRDADRAGRRGPVAAGRRPDQAHPPAGHRPGAPPPGPGRRRRGALVAHGPVRPRRRRGRRTERRAAAQA